MLTKLRIDNLKCFSQLPLPLAPLTLLTGFNAAGKSTAIQALLLLAQGCRHAENRWQIALNGDLAQLGTPGEALHEGKDNHLVLGLENETTTLSWVLKADKRNQAHAMQVERIDWQFGAQMGQFKQHDDTLLQLLPRDLAICLERRAHTTNIVAGLRGLVDSAAKAIFISAVRSGAIEAYPIPSAAEPVWADVGVRGEYAAWWLQQMDDEEVDAARCHPHETDRYLRRQFNAWAGELFPGVQVNPNRIANTQLVQLSWRNHQADSWRRPSNIGYGLTYILPLIVAGLLAKPGQVLVIDSPEAHLHPKGQSAMGRFLAMLANAGVQVVLETHSDHILNGVRLAISSGQLKAEQAAIHFFNARPRGDESHAHVISPQIDQHGNLSEWPVGFFDQTETDLAKLAGWCA